MAAKHEIRRNSDGSIDMAFYKARGRDFRTEAQRALVQRLCRAVVSGLESIAWRRAHAAHLRVAGVAHSR